MSLSLPLPADDHRTVCVTLVPFSCPGAPSALPRTLRVRVTKRARMSEVVVAVATLTSVAPEHIIVSDVYKHKVCMCCVVVCVGMWV